MPVVLRPPILRGGSAKIALLAVANPGAQGGQTGVTGYQRLPSEPIANVVLTLQNVVSGSAVLVADQSDAEIVRGTGTGADLPLAIPFFGAPRLLKVTVRKATGAPYYQSYETQVPVGAAGATLYVNQLSDDQ